MTVSASLSTGTVNVNLSTVTVTLYDLLGNLYTSPYSVSLSLYGTDPTATLSGTSTVTTTNGVASFTDLKIDKIGTYHVYATVTGTTIIPSAWPFTVSLPTNPTSLTISTIGEMVIGEVTTITVSFYAGTNLMTSTASNIAITLSTGSFGGTTTVSSVAGVATFNTVYLTSATSVGSITLTATSSSFSLTATQTFTAIRSAALVFTLSSQPHVFKTAGTYTYTLELSVKPISSSVTVAIASADTSKITVSTSSMTFTTSN